VKVNKGGIMKTSSASDGAAGWKLRSRLARGGVAGVLVAGTIVAAWAGTSGAGSARHEKLGSPVVIGASLSLTGTFSAAGKAFTRGYHLWQAFQNAHGGLLGHRIELKIISDKSTPNQAATNYTTLIAHDHVKLTIGPFSSLLTLPSAKVAHRYGYALIEGAGGAPKIFEQGLPNVFDVSYPVATGLVPFAKWLASMPKSKRPKSAAYATITTIFTSSQFPTARKVLEAAGVKTAYTNVFPTETTDFTPIADAMAASKATVALVGSVDVPTVSSFISAFETAHYNPKALIFTSGSDMGKTFLPAVGTKNALGVMNPNGWYAGIKNPLSTAMVKAYLKKYGGRVATINATTAEAYSVGEVLTQAVKATHSFSNKKILKFLHSGKTMTSVQGPVKFNKAGENIKGLVFAFQWQTKRGKPTLEQVLPVHSKGSVPPIYPKPAWGS
jgi:branched-chain amino acid transport system substrate-binding protein